MRKIFEIEFIKEDKGAVYDINVFEKIRGGEDAALIDCISDLRMKDLKLLYKTIGKFIEDDRNETRFP